MHPMNDLTIRQATPADAAKLNRLAALDSRHVPAAPQLLATDGDRLLAAISPRDGAIVADPFVPTADAVEILRRRARQVRAREQGDRPHRTLALLGHSFRVASW